MHVAAAAADGDDNWASKQCLVAVDDDDAAGMDWMKPQHQSSAPVVAVAVADVVGQRTCGQEKRSPSKLDYCQ